MRQTGSRPARPRALLVGGALVLVVGLGSPAAASVASDPAAGVDPASETLVLADQGGLHRSTLTPMVLPGCDSVTVDLPLVDGVTWWVQTQDMVWVAEPSQQVDPRATTVLTARLSLDRVFQDGSTSARWVVAPAGADISTGCTGGAPAAPVQGLPPATPAAHVQQPVPAVGPAEHAAPPATPATVQLAAPALRPAAAPAAVTSGVRTGDGAGARAPAAAQVTGTAGAQAPVPAAAPEAEGPGPVVPVAAAPEAEALVVAAVRFSDVPAEVSQAGLPSGETVRTLALASATTPARGSAAASVAILLALVGSGAAAAVALRRRQPREGSARG